MIKAKTITLLDVILNVCNEKILNNIINGEDKGKGR